MQFRITCRFNISVSELASFSFLFLCKSPIFTWSALSLMPGERSEKFNFPHSTVLLLPGICGRDAHAEPVQP